MPSQSVSNQSSDEFQKYCKNYYTKACNALQLEMLLKAEDQKSNDWRCPSNQFKLTVNKRPVENFLCSFFSATWINIFCVPLFFVMLNFVPGIHLVALLVAIIGIPNALYLPMYYHRFRRWFRQKVSVLLHGEEPPMIVSLPPVNLIDIPPKSSDVSPDTLQQIIEYNHATILAHVIAKSNTDIHIRNLVDFHAALIAQNLTALVCADNLNLVEGCNVTAGSESTIIEKITFSPEKLHELVDIALKRLEFATESDQSHHKQSFGQRWGHFLSQQNGWFVALCFAGLAALVTIAIAFPAVLPAFFAGHTVLIIAIATGFISILTLLNFTQTCGKDQPWKQKLWVKSIGKLSAESDEVLYTQTQAIDNELEKAKAECAEATAEQLSALLDHINTAKRDLQSGDLQLAYRANDIQDVSQQLNTKMIELAAAQLTTASTDHDSILEAMHTFAEESGSDFVLTLAHTVVLICNSDLDETIKTKTVDAMKAFAKKFAVNFHHALLYAAIQTSENRKFAACTNILDNLETLVSEKETATLSNDKYWRLYNDLGDLTMSEDMAQTEAIQKKVEAIRESITKKLPFEWQEDDKQKDVFVARYIQHYQKIEQLVADLMKSEKGTKHLLVTNQRLMRTSLMSLDPKANAHEDCQYVRHLWAYLKMTIANSFHSAPKDASLRKMIRSTYERLYPGKEYDAVEPDTMLTDVLRNTSQDYHDAMVFLSYQEITSFLDDGISHAEPTTRTAILDDETATTGSRSPIAGTDVPSGGRHTTPQSAPVLTSEERETLLERVVSNHDQGPANIGFFSPSPSRRQIAEKVGQSVSRRVVKDAQTLLEIVKQAEILQANQREVETLLRQPQTLQPEKDGHTTPPRSPVLRSEDTQTPTRPLSDASTPERRQLSTP